MSLEYPDCDNSDCYYRGREYRLQGGSDSHSFIHNKDIDSFDYYFDISSTLGPLQLSLCDVCINDIKMKGSCYLCKMMMADKWIILDNGNSVCRMCVSEDVLDISDDEYEKLLELCDNNINRLFNQSVLSKMKNHPDLYTQVMNTVEAQCKRIEKCQQEELLKKKQVKQDIKKCIQLLFPDLTESQIKKLCNKYNYKKFSFHNQYDFLMSLSIKQ